MKNRTAINLEVSLVEIIISVLIFTIMGVIMVNCFAIARYTQIKSNDMTSANLKAQEVLEYIKSSKDTSEMDEIINDSFNEINFSKDNAHTAYICYYDDKWKKCDNKDKLYSIQLDIIRRNINSGDMNDINISINRTNKYPFIDKEGDSSLIFFVETKKFFPKTLLGGK